MFRYFFSFGTCTKRIFELNESSIRRKTKNPLSIWCINFMFSFPKSMYLKNLLTHTLDLDNLSLVAAWICFPSPIMSAIHKTLWLDNFLWLSDIVGERTIFLATTVEANQTFYRFSCFLFSLPLSPLRLSPSLKTPLIQLSNTHTKETKWIKWWKYFWKDILI